MKKKEINSKAQLILNGHNEQVERVVSLLGQAIGDLVKDVQGKTGEELAGIMNFHYMELTQIVRKGGAIGYMEGLMDSKLK